jgi:hypothetical protein
MIPLRREMGGLVRISLLPAILLGIASCAVPQQPGAYCPWARQALAAEAPPSAGTPPAAPAAAPVSAPAQRGWPFTFSLWGPRSGRLTLSNFTFALADVEAIVTPYPDCALHPGVVARDFKLPLNGTWTIQAPPGSDVCWRRLPGEPGAGAVQAVRPPAQWNRAYTGAGRRLDDQL